MVEDNLLIMSKIIFNKRDRVLWSQLTDSQKSKYSFIINRYMAKEFPHLSEQINSKAIDGDIVYDIWWDFFKVGNMPGNFWSKGAGKTKSLKNEEIKWLMTVNKLDKLEDLEYIMKFYPDRVREELKRFGGV